MKKKTNVVGAVNKGTIIEESIHAFVRKTLTFPQLMKRRIWIVVLGAIMCLAWPLRAQFAYVSNVYDNHRLSLQHRQ
jgi:hypothetical protein